jgi:hypothetical protein
MKGEAGSVGLEMKRNSGRLIPELEGIRTLLMTIKVYLHPNERFETLYLWGVSIAPNKLEIAQYGLKLTELIKCSPENFCVYTLGEWTHLLGQKTYRVKDLTNLASEIIAPALKEINERLAQKSDMNVTFKYELLKVNGLEQLRVFVKSAPNRLEVMSVKLLKHFTNGVKSMALSIEDWLELFELQDNVPRNMREFELGIISPLIDYLNTPGKLTKFDYDISETTENSKIMIRMTLDEDKIRTLCLKLMEYLYKRPNNTASHDKSVWAALLELNEESHLKAIVTTINDTANGIIISLNETVIDNKEQIKLHMKEDANSLRSETFH